MRSKKTVLIVDDVPENLRIIQHALKHEFNIRMAKSGHIALGAIENNLVPDAILLDIEMPGINGFDLIKEIRKKKHLDNVPVIFITAHATEELVLRAAEHGAADYIAKPFDRDVLIEKLKKALENV